MERERRTTEERRKKDNTFYVSSVNVTEDRIHADIKIAATSLNREKGGAQLHTR
jgi:hypothetical protein